MRLWSLHPKYLDARGLVALWREALLAQAVLKGRTKGYTHHPQLLRFRQTDNPACAIARYLRIVHEEATRRGYKFDHRKIGRIGKSVASIGVTRGQMRYEWDHLRIKLALRAPEWLDALKESHRMESNPVFHVVAGGVEKWERIQ